MKKIKLTKNKYALVDDEDFDELNQYKWFAHKKRNNKYYSIRTVWMKMEKTKKTIRMHRVIMNCSDDKIVDHKDGNGLNNQRENLRICTNLQNQGNRKLNKNNTSGIRGVYLRKDDKKWEANIRINNKTKHLGIFTDKLEAKNVYTKAAKEHFGEFYNEDSG
jgi:hypothetical protein